MKTALWFILKFALVSIPLTWLWMEGGKYFYAQWFRSIAQPIYELFGFDRFPVPARDRYVHLIPFLALMVATPGIALARRVGFTLIGLFLTFVAQLALNWIAVSQSGKWASLPAPVAAFSDALPFALWALAARHLLQQLLGTTSSAAPAPHQRKEAADEVDRL